MSDPKRSRVFSRNFQPVFLTLVGVGAVVSMYVGLPDVLPIVYEAGALGEGITSEEPISGPPLIKHLETPVPLRALYMTACVAGTPTFRGDLVRIAEETEINAMVIDIKDYSGTISFRTGNPLFAAAELKNCGALDMKEFIAELHEKGIYVIGRITVFQDPTYTRAHPELAVLKESDGSVWKDYKGLSFIEVGARPYWEYIVTLSKISYELGFDELNYDYVRFPSDGNMQDIYYPFSESIIGADPRYGKALVLRDFFSYLHKELAQTGAILSVDLFGMTTTNPDDLNIGQILEYAEPYFDYIAPMVYPSHYPAGFNGWANPNKYPYEVVRFSMDRAVERLIATSTTIRIPDSIPLSTSTPALYPKQAVNPKKLRPWLQDFDYGGIYDADEVLAQIQATYDAGLDSWMLWAPSNRYTVEALATTTSGL
jgi:hypothetical protein